MDVKATIKKRRSVRRFQKKNVSTEQILSLLESGIHAPSEGNLQPWKFIVIRNNELKRKLTDAALKQNFIEEAPVAIVVCADLKKTSPYGERGRNLYCLQSTAAAIQNILLHATAEGLATCWVGAFDENRVSKILGLPSHLRPVAIIPVGYPLQIPSIPPRLPLEKVVEFKD